MFGLYQLRMSRSLRGRYCNRINNVSYGPLNKALSKKSLLNN